jgi:hypothetical protein
VIYHAALLGNMEIVLTSPAKIAQGEREEDPQLPFMLANSVTDQIVRHHWKNDTSHLSHLQPQHPKDELNLVMLVQ